MSNDEVIESLVDVILMIIVTYGQYLKALSEEGFDSEEFKEAYASQILEIKLKLQHRFEMSKGLGKTFPMVHVFSKFTKNEYEQFLLAFMISYELSAKIQEGITSLFRNVKTPTGEMAIHLYEFIGGNLSGELGQIFETETALDLCLIKGKEHVSILRQGIALEKNFVHYLVEKKNFKELQVFSCNEEISEVLIYDELLENAVTMTESKSLIYIYGQKSAGKMHFVKNLSAKIEKDIVILSWNHLKRMDKSEQEILLKQAKLYLYLYGGVVCVEDAPVEEDVEFVSVMEQLYSYANSTVVTGVEKYSQLYEVLSPFVSIHLYNMSASEKIKVWEHYKRMFNAQIDSVLCGNKYVLNIGGIHKTFQTANLLGDGSITTKEIEHAIKMLDKGLSHATLIRSSFNLSDLVVEENVKRQLEHVINQLQYKNKVYDEWGFGRKTTYGRGTSAMFYGPPGTGKTMAASVIANALSLDLYRVDISKMVSKYIGETEKNISLLFDEAKDMNILLFFDEADALFAKRMEVKDSNDRNANAETAHLLQKLEEYEGVAILATNLADQIDEAFSRRIKFMVKFRFPDVDTRKKLWKNLIPEEAEIEEDLYIDFFAEQFELSGSQIKEVIINAAYIAASEGTKLSNEAVKEALILNYQKYDKILGKNDFMYF